MTASTSLHSNAFNFMSFINGGVDPRTGLYTLAISLPELRSDNLAGPGLPLALGFNPLNTQDSGLGLGWNLQLSQYSRDTRILALSSGESYKVTEVDGRGQMLMKEKKLDSFHAAELVGNQYRIAHKSGQVEILQEMGSSERPVALPVQIRSADGRQMTLGYDYFNGQPLLAEVRDRQRRLLTLQRTGNQVLLSLDPDHRAALFSFSLSGADNRVGRITLPTAEQAGWRLEYQSLGGLLHVSEVATPSGAVETLRYDDAGHAFPGASGRPNLRRVTQHSIDPGRGQPPVVTRYSYGTRDVDSSHNFLGGNAPGLVWEDNGLDNLYKITGSYRYGSTETLLDSGQPVRSIERSFNRFHLLTEQLTTQNRKVQRSATVYHADDRLDFDRQPAYFQLPATVTDNWYDLDDSGRVRSEVVSTRYDGFGNLLEEIKANGITETRSWYPAAGEPGQCPADPEGFVRQLASSTLTPAALRPGEAAYGEAAPVLRHRYRYQALAPMGGSGQPWLVQSEDRLLQVQGSQETLLQTDATSYINDPADLLGHGRLLQQRVTLNGVTRLTDYRYHTGPGRSGASVLHTEQTLSSSLDAERKLIKLEHSLLNGLELLVRDQDSDVEIRYQYDALQRVTGETVAPDTPYQASRTYRYGLAGDAGQGAWQEVSDVKEVTVRSEVDGLNRVIEERRQDADGDNALRLTYSAQYDARGQLASETDYDWLQERDLALTRRYTYDDWGERISETGPDQVLSFTRTDPVGTAQGPVREQWQQTSARANQRYGLTVSQLNLFDEVASSERFTVDGQSLGSHTWHYDGLGRLAEEVDALSHVTGYRYDVFDRQMQQILPGLAVVARTYAAHSAEDLPVSIRVQDVLLGEQGFDSLERRISATTGGRRQLFAYLPGQTRPASVDTASGQHIEYVYAPALGEEPLARRIAASNIDARYDYDPRDARLLDCSEQGMQLSRGYFSTGELSHETRTDGSDTYRMSYRYSRLGRLLAYTDVLGQTQTLEYDPAGRLQLTRLGSTEARFSYDGLGQLQEIACNDGALHLTTRLAYDDHGRERERVFDMGTLKQTLVQVYDDTDRLRQRTLHQGQELLRDEHYVYDPRGRLTRYTCTGSQRPVDPYGKTINAQLFRFDDLDNLTLVQTSFDGGSNNARYFYDNQDPVQLSSVSNSHADYPAEILLDYDDDGNLTRDEQGRTLSYDALGRLLHVSGPAGGGQYRYDPLDILGAANDQQRFYCAGQLTTLTDGQQHAQWLWGEERLLARAGQGPLATDASNSVLYESDPASPTACVYTPYGHRHRSPPAEGGPAFNGEYAEPASGWQLLGNGYRAFNPALMRFHSPDSLSPFAEGWVNAYAYCEGDPVNGIDPSGHGFWSGLARTVKLKPRITTASSAAQQVPDLLKVLPQGKEVSRLRSLKPRDVENLSVIAQDKARQVDALNSRMARLEQGLESVQSSRKGGYKADQLLLERESAVLSAESTQQALAYARQQVGKPAITGYVREGIERQASDIRKQLASAEAYQARVLRDWQVKKAGTKHMGMQAFNTTGPSRRQDLM